MLGDMLGVKWASVLEFRELSVSSWNSRNCQRTELIPEEPSERSVGGPALV